MAAKQIQTNVKAAEYEFLDADGNILFTIRFNPDLDIARRYNKTVDFLNKMFANIGNDEKSADVFFEKCDELRGELNELFNCDIATPIFSVMNPFTPLESGKFYIDEIMEKLGDIVEAEFDTRVKRVQSRQNKYTAKYHK
nr:MAG TPA: tail assembly chaperone [Caudoviricetes sp.]DAH23338.1 MAG TPA: tail assembly chaperone [Caudoviricetes sp.]